MRKQDKVILTFLSMLASRILQEEVKVVAGNQFSCNLNGRFLFHQTPCIEVVINPTWEMILEHEQYNKIVAKVYNTYDHLQVSPLLFGFLHEVGHFASLNIIANRYFDILEERVKVSNDAYSGKYSQDEIWINYANLEDERVATEWAFDTLRKSLSEFQEIDKLIAVK